MCAALINRTARVILPQTVFSENFNIFDFFFHYVAHTKSHRVTQSGDIEKHFSDFVFYNFLAFWTKRSAYSRHFSRGNRGQLLFYADFQTTATGSGFNAAATYFTAGILAFREYINDILITDNKMRHSALKVF